MTARVNQPGAAPSAPIPFIDLKAQRERLGERIDAALQRVIDRVSFINGPEVRELEKKLAAFAGCKHAIGCSSGTDALLLPLMARGIGSGDAVFLPAFTFTATPEVVALLGATPVFVDVDETTFNLDVNSLSAAITAAHDGGLRPAAIIAVDLFGLPADYVAINRIAKEYGLFVVEDAAQSFGASLGNKRACSLAEIGATSFFPAKPLGCYGDGGAVFTDDEGEAALLESLREHGQGSHRYDTVRVGMNGRIDTLQAAILIEKLVIFEDELLMRQRVAERYTSMLAETVVTPRIPDGSSSAWAQYTILVPNRDAVAAGLRDRGIPTAVYYPRPLNEQPAYASYPVAPGGVPVSTRLAQEVLSLPMHPYLDEQTQDYIVEGVIEAVRGS